MPGVAALAAGEALGDGLVQGQEQSLCAVAAAAAKDLQRWPKNKADDVGVNG
jgi:hypothetical protein